MTDEEPAADLRGRWMTERGVRLQTAAVAWLLGLGDKPSELSEHRGRADLRGIDVVVGTTGQVVRAGRIRAQVLESAPLVRSRSWNRIDLSYARLPHLRFYHARIDDCRFIRADLTDLRLWNTTVVDCEFHSSDLRSSALGTWQERERNEANTWIRCSFVRCDLRDAFFRGGRITGCAFDRGKLDGLSFEQVRLRDVTFIGPLCRLKFDQRAYPDRPRDWPLVDVDFSQATLHEVQFLGCRFVRTNWPVERDLHLVAAYPQKARQALGALQGLDTEEGRFLTRILQQDVRGFRDSDHTQVINLADFRHLGGEVLVGLVESTLLGPSTAPAAPQKRAWWRRRS